MRKKITAAFAAVVLLVAGLVTTATVVSAHTPSVGVTCSALVNYVWTGGPVTGPPPVGGDGWHANNGEHNGQPHQQPVGTPYQVGNGNGDWFLWGCTPTPPVVTPPVVTPPVVTLPVVTLPVVTLPAATPAAPKPAAPSFTG